MIMIGMVSIFRFDSCVSVKVVLMRRFEMMVRMVKLIV